jgi:hypothetical protein
MINEMAAAAQCATAPSLRYSMAAGCIRRRQLLADSRSPLLLHSAAGGLRIVRQVSLSMFQAAFQLMPVM